MNQTKKLDPDAVINPSTGIYARNPTRLEITESAEDQQEIVNMVMKSNRGVQSIEWHYNKDDRTDLPPMSGVLNIRGLDVDQLDGFFSSLMRVKPNILKLHVKLGEYENKREIRNNKVSVLNGNKKRFATDVAKKIADVFDDAANNVVEFIYTCDPGGKDGFFSSTFIAYSVNEDDYNNDELFNPAIGLRYIQPS